MDFPAAPCCAQTHPGESLAGFTLCSTELRFTAADYPLCWLCRCLQCWQWGVREHSRAGPLPSRRAGLPKIQKDSKNPSAMKLQRKTPTILGFTWKWQHMLNVKHQPLPKVELFWAHPEDAGRADASLPPSLLLEAPCQEDFHPPLPLLGCFTKPLGTSSNILRGEGSSLLAFGPRLPFCKGLFCVCLVIGCGLYFHQGDFVHS